MSLVFFQIVSGIQASLRAAFFNLVSNSGVEGREEMGWGQTQIHDNFFENK